MARRTEQLKIAVFFNFLQNRTRPSFFPHHTSISARSRCAAPAPPYIHARMGLLLLGGAQYGLPEQAN
jgi:hypothetical protein